MKKMTSFKAPLALSALFLVTAVAITGCSGDTEENTAAAPTAEQATKAMDVKPADVAPAEKAPLVKMEEMQKTVEKAVEEKVEQVKDKAVEVKEAAVETKQEVTAKVDQVVKAVTTPAGQSAYSTCVGCHGANGEGGVGPRLNNQTVEDIVVKLEKYKAGEQVGPMTGMMAPMAAGLSTDDMTAIAQYITTK